MDAVIVVEVLDRAGRVRQRAKLDAFPCTVGRAYTCDVIVDDRTVSPEHVRLERDEAGGLAAVDLDSLNGTWGRDGRRVTRATLGADDRLRIGHTGLRIRRADHPVEATVPDRPRALVSGAVRALAVIALGIVVTQARVWLQAFEPSSTAETLDRALPQLVAVTVWAGGWALVSRVVAHHARFLEHAAVAMLALAAAAAGRELVECYAFGFAGGRSVGLLAVVVPGLVVTGLLHAHLRRCAQTSSRLRLLAVSAAAGVLVVGGAATARLAPARDDMPALLAGLKPRAFRVVAGRDVDAFFADAGRLKSAVDGLEAAARDGD